MTSPPLDGPPRRSFVEQVMGMPVSVMLRGADARGPQPVAAVQAAFGALREVDAVLSLWRPASPLSRLARRELGVADCPPVVAEVLQLCEQARSLTDGWFDHEPARPDGRRGLDPTGLVKGWAVQGALRVLLAGLAEAGLEGLDAAVNAGGDVAVHLGEPSGRWLVGIQDPADGRRLVAAVPLAGGGIATSGTAARGGHIVVPATGGAARDLLSVSVWGPSLCWADVWATAAFARGRDAASWLAGRAGFGAAGYAALVVGLDGVPVRLDPGSALPWSRHAAGTADPAAPAPSNLLSRAG